MEAIGQAAARLLARLERAAKAKEKIAGRVDRKSADNPHAFPDATEHRPAPDAGLFCGDFTTPGSDEGREPGNVRQGFEIQESASRSAGPDGEKVPSLCPARQARRMGCNDNRRDHVRTSDLWRTWMPF